MDGFFALRPGSKVRGYSNVITIFLDSLARSRHNGIAIILSGMDEDGAVSLNNFKANGGITIVQAPRLAERPEMPLAAIETGCVDYVLAPDAIAPELQRIADHFKGSGSFSAASEFAKI